MNIKILDKLFFGQNSKKTSQKEKNIWYFSFLILMLIPIYFIKDISIFFFQNNYIISVLALSIYVLYGIKKHTWVNGFQKFLLSIIFIALILGTSFQESKYFLNLKQYSEFHNTKVGSDLWFNLKIKDNNTYEIQVASPKDGKWVDVKKGKISALTKQRYRGAMQPICIGQKNF